jgi:hypothetical protein
MMIFYLDSCLNFYGFFVILPYNFAIVKAEKWVQDNIYKIACLIKIHSLEQIKILKRFVEQ